MSTLKQTKVSNVKLASFLGISESTVRARKKKIKEENCKETEEQLDKDILSCIENTHSFYTLDEYIKITDREESKEELIKLIEAGEIPGIVQEDNIFVPSIFDSFNVVAPEIRDLFPLVITNSNHKGGVSKTTNTLNLAAVYALMGLKVLIVDFDPQGNASQAFGYVEGKDGKTVVDLIFNLNNENIEQEIRDTIIDLGAESKFSSPLKGSLHLLPNNDDMVSEVEKLPFMTGELGAVENTLDEVLSYIKDDYDVILIDTPPRADILLRTAIMASQYVLISLKTEPFAKTGMPKIISNIKKFEKGYKRQNNKDIQILGGIVSDYTGNSNLNKVNLEQIKQDLTNETNGQSVVFETLVPKRVSVPESQQGAGSVIYDSPNEDITRCYMDLSIDILDKVVENKFAGSVK